MEVWLRQEIGRLALVLSMILSQAFVLMVGGCPIQKIRSLEFPVEPITVAGPRYSMTGSSGAWTCISAGICACLPYRTFQFLATATWWNGGRPTRQSEFPSTCLPSPARQAMRRPLSLTRFHASSSPPPHTIIGFNNQQVLTAMDEKAKLTFGTGGMETCMGFTIVRCRCCLRTPRLAWLQKSIHIHTKGNSTTG
ncbi:hypothetical protein K461DRAFT_40153 [Myriangium duriaei CBS 260.36]|uniref:Uncharacterized protein n=1 Tax=Myriangium duriaei CBS 260.36 TaxID=1168546 RepID=A0A9P4IUB1_9PEZI|nr:hypothetical protein K461DRAFT_40153 [Myriangium duriaei CBS 260.36]